MMTATKTTWQYGVINKPWQGKPLVTVICDTLEQAARIAGQSTARFQRLHPNGYGHSWEPFAARDGEYEEGDLLSHATADDLCLNAEFIERGIGQANAD